MPSTSYQQPHALSLLPSAAHHATTGPLIDSVPTERKTFKLLAEDNKRRAVERLGQEGWDALSPAQQEDQIVVELSSCGEHANVNFAGDMEKAMDTVVRELMAVEEVEGKHAKVKYRTVVEEKKSPGNFWMFQVSTGCMPLLLPPPATSCLLLPPPAHPLSTFGLRCAGVQVLCHLLQQRLVQGRAVCRVPTSSQPGGDQGLQSKGEVCARE